MKPNEMRLSTRARALFAILIIVGLAILATPALTYVAIHWSDNLVTLSPLQKALPDYKGYGCITSDDINKNFGYQYYRPDPHEFTYMNEGIIVYRKHSFGGPVDEMETFTYKGGKCFYYWNEKMEALATPDPP